MNEKAIYEVISNHEVPELSKIKKSNIVAEITLADTLKAIEQNKKGMESIQSEVNLKKALIENIKTHHPKAFEIDPELQVAVHTLHEAKRYVDIAEKKLAEFEEAQKELEDEVKEIEIQTGLRAMTTAEKLELLKKKDEIGKELKK